MHAFIEEPVVNRCDCPIQSLSWMGRTPDSQPELGAAWCLNESNYYDEGWLASGNTRGVVGVTFTSCLPTDAMDAVPNRTNFNLRGHRTEVILVKWNEPYQKLATCDVTGIIFVWIKHDGRWSIELINDRSSQVTDFAWSHDGQMALICYKDSFVLVGSVAGQRYWSSMLNLEGCLVTCGIWTPDDQKVMFGTSAGKVIVMSASGTMLAQVIIHDGLEITYLSWSTQRFYLVNQESSHPPVVSTTNQNSALTSQSSPYNGNTDGGGVDISCGSNKPYILSVTLSIGDILLMTSYDDVCPKVIHTGLTGVKMEWSNDGELLAVAGYVRQPNQTIHNEVRFYRRSSRLQLILTLPCQGKQPITALTWGHNDKKVFVAAGCDIYTVWVIKQVASLQLLCKRCIQQQIKEDSLIAQLPLPNKLQTSLADLFMSTIRGYIPYPGRLREFVCRPPPCKDRLHCTIIRHGDEPSGTGGAGGAGTGNGAAGGGYYTLYLEYLGGLIPLLKGKRASKLHPDFVIFDPQNKVTAAKDDDVQMHGDSMQDESDSDCTTAPRDGCASPGSYRKKRFRRRLTDSLKCREFIGTERQAEELPDDGLPESSPLIEITSNIWGTKFRFVGLAPFLPDNLGSVTYKTSLLHLQPRQMTVAIVDLTGDVHPQSLLDPTSIVDYVPNNCLSESEDEPAPSVYGIGCEIAADSSLESSIPVVNNTELLGVCVPSPSHCCDSTPAVKQTTPSPGSLMLAGQQRSLHRLYSHLQTSAQAERLTRVSPTEVDPFTRDCHHLSAINDPCPLYAINPTTPFSGEELCRPAENNNVSMSPAFRRPTYASRNFSGAVVNRLSEKYDNIDNNTVDSKCDNMVGVSMDQNGNVDGTLMSIGGNGGGANGNRTTINDIRRGETAALTSMSLEVSWWADKACEEIQFIDDDCDDKTDLYARQISSAACHPGDEPAVYCTGPVGLSARDIMKNTQMSSDIHQAMQRKVELERSNATHQITETAAVEFGNVSVHRSGGGGVVCEGMRTSPVKRKVENDRRGAERNVRMENETNRRASDHDPLESRYIVTNSIENCIRDGGGHSIIVTDIQSNESFEPRKTLILLTPGSPTPVQDVRQPRSSRLREMARNALCHNRSVEMFRGKRRGLCGIANPILPGSCTTASDDCATNKSSDSSPLTSNQNSPVMSHATRQQRCASFDAQHYLTTSAAGTIDSVSSNGNVELVVPLISLQSTSLPASPVHKGDSHKPKSTKQVIGGRSKLQSPLMSRRLKNNTMDSSDDEFTMSAEEVTTSENYRDLETFQKAQLNKKLRKVRRSRCEKRGNDLLVCDTGSTRSSPSRNQSPLGGGASARSSRMGSPVVAVGSRRHPRRLLVMYNKAPMWNESSQVYQLDFGGRVTQESAKNFQIEFGGKQVMQFGRIDNNAYTLDFQYPYSAVQAFAVALANVTQRLK